MTSTPMTAVPNLVLARYVEHSQSVLSEVHPQLRTRALSMLRFLVLDGHLYFAPFQGFRSFAQQAEDYAQGRTKPGRIVTKAQPGQSLHNYGLALDWAEDADPDNDRGIQWSWSKNADYLKIGTYAKRAELEWGGFWRSFRDLPHVQLTGGLTLEQIQDIYQAAPADQKLPAVWQKVTEALIDLDRHEGIVA